MRVTLFAAALVLTLGAAAQAQTLDRIAERGELRIGFREDASPMSYRNAVGEAAGFSVELCKVVAATVEATLDLAELRVTYVPVSTQDRFDAIVDGRIDLLCGAATITLPRRTKVDFSIPIFIDGASVIYRAGGPASFDQLNGHKIGVRGATTTEQALRNTLSNSGIIAEVVPVDSHVDGVQRLEQGELSAYFGDRAILQGLMLGRPVQGALVLSDRYFSYEPYGLALLLGDTNMRILVDAALSRVYRAGGMQQLFEATFGTNARPSNLLRTLYLVSALPE